jgi:two-component system sensor kinase FixL
MSALAGSMAHDLSQPLSAIEFNAHAAELILSTQPTPDALAGILADIREANARASEIVGRHRTMLKTHQVQMEPVDVRAVVKDSVALVAHDTRARGVAVDVDLSPVPCVIAGDRVLLQQVLVNLLMNGLDAMLDVPPGRRRMRVASDVGPDTVDITVRDSGPGLPAQLNGEVFEPFRTTKKHGIGIGLTIARTIVHAHHGAMDAHSNPDGGATFRIRLPRRATAPTRSGANGVTV